MLRAHIFSMAQQPLVGQGLLFVENLWSHSNTPLGKSPLDEWSARRQDLYLTRNNSQKRETSKPRKGIRTCNTSKWAAADASVRAATVIVTMHLQNK